MYYPIIDKLKEVMANITSVKDKEPLVIEGTITSQSGGNWSGEWNDIISAFQNNKPVYFKITIALTNTTFIIPIISIDTDNANSSIIYFNNMMAYGSLTDINTFELVPIQ